MKKFICILLVISMVLPCALLGVHAEEVSADDFKTWTQGDPRWGGYVYGSSNTIEYSGCMIASLAVLIAYSDPTKRDWNTFNPKTLAQNNLRFYGNELADWRVFDLEGGDNFLFVESETTYSRSEAAKVVKKNMLAGNYTMVFAYKDGVYSHFCPVVGWNEETEEPILWDVGSGLYGNDVCEPGCPWNTYFRRAEGGTYTVISYKSLVSSALDTIYNDNFDPSKSDSAEEILQRGKSIVKEWELSGMPMKSDMVSNQISVRVGDALTWDSQLQATSQAIKEGIEKDKTAVDYMRISMSFGGILLLVYSMMLLLGYSFDSVNSFIDINFVSLLTMGKIRISDDTVDKSLKKKGYVTKKSFFIRVSVIICVGILLVSGIVSVMVYKAMSLFG